MSVPGIESESRVERRRGRKQETEEEKRRGASGVMGRASKREMKARNKLQAAGSRDDVPQRGEGTGGQGLVVRNIEK